MKLADRQSRTHAARGRIPFAQYDPKIKVFDDARPIARERHGAPGVAAIVLRPSAPPARYTNLAPARPVEVFSPGILRTARLTLRPLRESDRFEFLRVINISREYLRPCSGLYREGETDDQLFERQMEACRAGDEHATAWRRIAVLDDGHIAGAFNLNTITRGLNFDADASWWISADQARQGLGTEGVQAMLEFALSDLPRGLGLQLVRAAIMPCNAASIRLARQVGLRRQPGGRASIRLGNRWELHEIYERSADVSFGTQRDS